jgi:predicted transcriptional regulator
MRNIGFLDALLPKTRQGILAALLGRPEKPWYVSELAKRMGYGGRANQHAVSAGANNH